MNTHPWLTEQVVRSRMEDVRREAGTRQLLAAACPPAGWSRQVGVALIRAGRRLAGPDAVPAGEPRLVVPRDVGGLGAGC